MVLLNFTADSVDSGKPRTCVCVCVVYSWINYFTFFQLSTMKAEGSPIRGGPFKSIMFIIPSCQ